MYTDRLPPHDIAAEEAVLGSILIDGDSFSLIASKLNSNDFYGGKNRFCFESLFDLYNRGDVINQITVANDLRIKNKLDEVGGQAYLNQLIVTVPTSLHVEHFADIVIRSATMRKLIEAGSEIVSIGYSDTVDLEDSFSKAQDLLLQIRPSLGETAFLSMRDILDKYLEDIPSGDSSQTTSRQLSSGFDELDTLLGGLQGSDMLVLASRPSFGKSTLAANMAVNVASKGFNVGIFSLEMSREQLAIRMIASESGVNAHTLRLGNIDANQQALVLDAVGKLSELPIYIDDTPLHTINEMRIKAKSLASKINLDFLIVDYLQLIRGSNYRSDNRVQEVSDITRSLKLLARDINVPLIAVSQLSRAVEQRASHRPQLSDLRESGSIEQDADLVLFIHREDKAFTEDEWIRMYPDREYPRNIAEIIVAKHRNGPVGSVRLYFDENLSVFKSISLGSIDEQQAIL